MKKVKGSTLIEVIIYIALFSILTVGGFVSAVQIIDSSNKTNRALTAQEEGNFVVRKISWAMSNLDPLNPPAVTGSGCEQILTLNKTDYFSNPVVFRKNLSKVEIKQGNNDFVPVTTENVDVSCLEFKIIFSTNNSPFGISATTTVNDTDFSITKYERK